MCPTYAYVRDLFLDTEGLTEIPCIQIFNHPYSLNPTSQPSLGYTVDARDESLVAHKKESVHTSHSV